MGLRRCLIWIVFGGCIGLAVGLSQMSGCVDDAVFNDGGTVVDASLGDGALAGLESIKILPEDAVLVTTGEKPVTQLYKAVGVFAGGEERDVTPETQFEVLDARVGIFTDNSFNASLNWGGNSTVKATTTNDVTATTSVTVVYTRRFMDSGLPPDIDTQFDEADQDVSVAPILAYPPDGVLLPPNLLELEVQWNPGGGHDLFEVAFLNDGTDIRIYTTCAKIGSLGCGHVPSEEAWRALVGASKGHEAVQVRVRSGVKADLRVVGVSNAHSILMAEEDIKGGLYYWAATMTGGIIRYDFGRTDQKATSFYTAQDAEAQFCVGCHAMSLNGKRMAVGLDMPAPAPLKVLDVATREVLAQGAANFMAFSPDGEKIITSDGNSMVLRKADTLEALDPNPLRAKGSLPDWSPNGARVVYSEPGAAPPIPVGQPGVDKGSLKLLAYNESTDSWSSPATLVESSGENNFYPTFSPDNETIIFNRASGNSYDNPGASLWAVRTDGKAPPVELEAANGGQNLTNSWPKFSPFIQTYQGRKIMWFTFSSRRQYGLYEVGGGDGRWQAQIWMAAFDLGKDEMTSDPSYPAFRLPFQDINTGNHIAQWTMEVVRKPCGVDGDCPEGETCSEGLCEPDET